MAGGKLTPRQKMINLMYLVFIAMLAMNMSKEVLSAFGLMNEKFEGANSSAKATNEQMMMALDAKATEAKGDFAVAAVTAHKVEAATKKFYAFVETLKAEVLKGVESENGKLPYEAMDKADNIDNSWFSGDGYSKRGNEVIAAIETFKSEMKAALPEKKYSPILNEVTKKFDLSDVANKEGIKVKFLDYHFKGFPAIASLAKLSAWQNDAKKAESDVISAALGKAAVETASLTNYKAIVVLDKNAYFQGESVTGKVFLGRYDEDTKPSNITGPGRLDPTTGQAKISLTAGAVGEQKFGGEFKFVEDGKPVNLKYEGNYVVVPRPNSATISADKMNVVYRGVPNPMTISFAGVGNNKVKASAPGMTGSDGKYILRPGAGSSVMINVSATLPDGKTVSDRKEFRIKGLPAPTGKIRGEVAAKGSKPNLQACTVSAIMEDFDFPVTVNVTQFNIKVPGQPTIVVSGSKMDARAISAIGKAQRGDVVVISEIKASFSGIDQLAKRVSTCTFEVQ